MRRTHGLVLSFVLALATVLIFRPRAETVDRVANTPVPVAVCIVGLSGGAASLAEFGMALQKHLRPRPEHTLSFFVWLQDDAAERQLELSIAHLGRVTTRGRMLSSLPAALAETDLAAIARLHPVRKYGDAWTNGSDVNPLNTLRMLRKFMAVEALRRHDERHDQGSQRQEHKLVLRIRPDLILLGPLELPPRLQEGDVRVPWACEVSGLVSDQLMLSTPEAAAYVAKLWDPEVLHATMLRVGGTLYPELILGAHLDAGGYAPTVQPTRTSLLSRTEGWRDPHAKLRRDFPVCDFPVISPTTRRS